MTFGSLIGIAAGVYVLYGCCLAIYRLFIHPLAKFPGPKLPACSLWYEFYYDVILRGQFIWQIQKWHEEYGPIIRISPDEIHIFDSDYYDEIYGSQVKRRDKYGPWVVFTGCPGSVFATAPHDHHRLRRSALNPFFSKKAVTELEPLIQDKVSTLVTRFDQACSTGQVIRADVAFSALTTDVISQYIFATDDNYLLEDDFKLEWKECLSTGFEAGAIGRQFPWMIDMMKRLPDSVAAKLSPPLAMQRAIRVEVEKRAQAVLEGTILESTLSHRTIFHELKDGNLPPEEKTVERLCDETHILTGAGSETTAKTLSHITYYLLANPEKLQRMRNELKTVLPGPNDSVSHTVIEQLPYVSAVISEGLRLSYGVTTRLPRVAPIEPIQYGEWIVPPGTPVSATAYFTLLDEKIFHEPHKFIPERWLPENMERAGRPNLQRYLVNFGKGSRQCIGMNLAYAEIYLTVAALFRRFEMEIYETTIDDLLCKHDFFTAAAGPESKGIRIRVVKRLKD